MSESCRSLMRWFVFAPVHQTNLSYFRASFSLRLYNMANLSTCLLVRSHCVFIAVSPGFCLHRQLRKFSKRSKVLGARIGVGRLPLRRSRNAINSARCRTPRGYHRRSGRHSRVRVMDPKNVRPRRSRGAQPQRIRTRWPFVPFSCSGPLLLKQKHFSITLL